MTWNHLNIETENEYEKLFDLFIGPSLHCYSINELANSVIWLPYQIKFIHVFMKVFRRKIIIYLFMIMILYIFGVKSLVFFL